MRERFRPFSNQSKDFSLGSPEEKSRRASGTDKISESKAGLPLRLKKGAEHKLRIIEEKGLAEGDQITDGKFSGPILRIEKNGDVIMGRAGRGAPYHPDFVTKIPKQEK